MVGVPVSDNPVYSIQSIPSYPNRIIRNQQEPRSLLLVLFCYGVTVSEPDRTLSRLWYGVPGLTMYVVQGASQVGEKVAPVQRTMSFRTGFEGKLDSHAIPKSVYVGRFAIPSDRTRPRRLYIRSTEAACMARGGVSISKMMKDTRAEKKPVRTNPRASDGIVVG